MWRFLGLVLALCCLRHIAPVSAQDKVSPGKLSNGVYAVLRDDLEKKKVLPLKAGEHLLVQRHRYAKKEDRDSPRFLVVRSRPDVALDLEGAPRGIEEGGEVVRILMKLKPKAAAALAKVTSDHLGRNVTIVIDGDVVTMHKIREPIKGGEVQITSCAPGAARFLLDQLKTRHKDN